MPNILPYGTTIPRSRRGGSDPDRGAWSHYFEIEAQASQVTGLVYDVWIDLSRGDIPAALWTRVASDGKDIRVRLSDGVTNVPFDLAFIDTVAEVGGIFFKAVGLSAIVDTTYRIYYGNPLASAYPPDHANGRFNAYHPEMLLVSHDAGITDRTILENDAFALPSGVTLSVQRGLSGNFGIDFDGGGDRQITTPFENLTMPFLIEAWCRPTVNNVDAHVISNWNASATDDAYVRGDPAGAWHLSVDDPPVNVVGAGSITVDTWQWVGGYLSDLQGGIIRKNAANLQVVGVGADQTIDNGSRFGVGGRPLQAGGGFTGQIEHVRIREGEVTVQIRDTRGRNFTVAGFWVVGAEVSTFDPLTLLPALFLRGGAFEDDAGTNPCEDADLVFVWKDSSPNLDHLVRAIASGTEPTFRQAHVGVEDYIQFVPTDLLRNIGLPAFRNDDFEFACVVDSLDHLVNNNQTLFALGSSSFETFEIRVRAVDGNFLIFNGDGASFEQLFIAHVHTPNHTFRVRGTPAGYEVWIDGVSVGSAARTKTATGITEVYLGARSGFSDGVDAHIVAPIFIDRVLTPAEAAVLDDYLLTNF